MNLVPAEQSPDPYANDLRDFKSHIRMLTIQNFIREEYQETLMANTDLRETFANEYINALFSGSSEPLTSEEKASIMKEPEFIQTVQSAFEDAAVIETLSLSDMKGRIKGAQGAFLQAFPDINVEDLFEGTIREQLLDVCKPFDRALQNLFEKLKEVNLDLDCLSELYFEELRKEIPTREDYVERCGRYMDLFEALVDQITPVLSTVEPETFTKERVGRLKKDVSEARNSIKPGVELIFNFRADQIWGPREA